MKAYIGTPGRMIALPYVSSESIELEDVYSFQTTLEGRVKAQVRPVANRAWSVAATRYLSDAQGLLFSFVSGEWGRGPFVWVAVDAPVTNLLTPKQSMCDPSTIFTSGVTAAGPLLTPDGWVGRSFTNATQSTPFYFGPQAAPVIAGQKVTASAYLVGAGAAVRIIWQDAAGIFISSTTGSAGGLAGTVKRLSVTATPPANAAQAQVLAVNATQGARPALTWTDTLFEWSDGQGCPKAVIHAGTRDIRSLSTHQLGIRAADVGFTVTEVG